jgi:hypothetical protein
LAGVSCASTSACIAVGRHPVAGVGTLPLMGRWNGADWTTQGSRLLRGAMNAVSCYSPTACTAVGSTLTHTGGVPLIERWNGSSWRVQRAA